ncbi:MAG: PHP domain-containing protein [Clostridia bacterium]|nr:PHP domain-containing protein [Clostridia bacterium]
MDLHMHTTISDGSDSPEEILARVREAGIQLFSVTDHDAMKGCEIIRSVRTKEDPAFINGIEFSCKDEYGKYHILGYGYDPDSEAMRKVVEVGHGHRIRKVKARLEYLKETFGFHFTDEEIRELFKLDNPGKPHIGNLMVKHGYAGSIKEAIDGFINKKKFHGNEHVRPEEAIEGILGGGGIPVLAHPVYGDGGQLILGDEMEDRIKRLMDFGLKGLECFYSGFTDKLRDQMLDIARRHGLYVTAGSDYHGTNKLEVLGENGLDAVKEWQDGLERFLKDVRIEE